MSDEIGPIATVSHDGFSISSNESSAKDIKANLESEPAPLDGTPEEAEESKEKEAKKKRSEAASELGKAGGKAAAEARKAQDDLDDEEEAPEAKEPEKKAVEAPEDEEEPSKGNPRRDAKARIQQLARERAEERSKRVALEARLEALEAAKAPPKPEPTPEPGKPQPDQYETYEQYVEALTDHKMEERIRKMAKEAQDRQRVDAHTKSVIERVDGFNERIKGEPELMERVDPRLLDLQPTFTLPPGKTPGPQNDLAEEIVSSPMAPRLLMYLTENEGEVRRILALPNSREITRAIAHLEAKLEEGPAPIPPHTSQEGSVKQFTFSKAAPPVTPIKGSPSVTEDDADDDTPFDKHYAIMQAREGKLRRGR